MGCQIEQAGGEMKSRSCELEEAYCVRWWSGGRSGYPHWGSLERKEPGLIMVSESVA